MSDIAERARAAASEAEQRAGRLAGKYLAFEVAQEAYGLPLLDVREIDGLAPITRLPGSPPFVRGVIDLRGRVIPVIDLRVRFGLPPTVASEQTVVVVVQARVAARAAMVGLLVDRVLEVVALDASTTEPPPDPPGLASTADFLAGVGRLPGRVVFLLDVARILTMVDAPGLGASPATAALPARGHQPS